VKSRSDRSGSRSKVRPSIFGNERTFQHKLRAAAGRGVEGIGGFEKNLGLRARKVALRERHPQFGIPVADLYGNERPDSLFTPPSMTTGLFATTDWAVRPPAPISDTLSPDQLQTLLQQQNQISAQRRNAIGDQLARLFGETLFLLPCARDAMQFLIHWIVTGASIPHSAGRPQNEGRFHEALSRHLIALGHSPKGLSAGSLSSKIKIGAKRGLDRTTTMRGGSFQLELYALQLLTPWEKLAFALILDQQERTARAHELVGHTGRCKAALADFCARDDGEHRRVVGAYRRVVGEMSRIAINKGLDPETRRLIRWRREAIPYLVCGGQGLVERIWGWGGFSPDHPPSEETMAEFGDELLRDLDSGPQVGLDYLVHYGKWELARASESGLGQAR